MFVSEISILESINGLFENNLINWLILVIGLSYLWNKNIVPGLLQKNQENQELVAKAQTSLALATELLDNQTKKNEGLNQSVDAIIADAHKLAQDLVEQNNSETKQKIEQIQAHTENMILEARKNFVADIRRALVESVFDVVNRDLSGEICDQNSQDTLNKDFLEKLLKLDKSAAVENNLMVNSSK